MEKDISGLTPVKRKLEWLYYFWPKLVSEQTITRIKEGYFIMIKVSS